MNDAIINAVKVIKAAILESQAQVLRNANGSLLSLYYGIGRFVSANSRKGTWETGAIAAISERLQKEMPGLHGFGERNIKNMRTFYEFWSPLIGRQSAASDSGIAALVTLDAIRQPTAAEFDLGALSFANRRTRLLSNMPFGTSTSQWALRLIGLPRRCRRGCATPCRQSTS